MPEISPRPGPPQLVLPRAAWPALHRDLLEKGLQVDGSAAGRLGERTYASRRRPATLKNAEKGWGRFTAVLAEAGRLDPEALPAACVTPENVRLFLDALAAQGNTDNTKVTRIFDIRAALRIMQPEVELSWLTTPGGESLRKYFDAQPKPKEGMHSGVLLAWGIALMEAAPRRGKAPERLSQYRNGLIIAIMALIAPRQRTMAALRLGRNLTRVGTGYRLRYLAEDMKEKNARDFAIPDFIVPHLQHYLDVVRPALLGDQRSDWLWVHAEGERYRERSLGTMIWRESERWFGKAFGPHAFRHALGTTAPTLLPDHPGLAAAILANRQRTADGTYNHTRDEDAFAAHVRHVQEERRRTAPAVQRQNGGRTATVLPTSGETEDVRRKVGKSVPSRRGQLQAGGSLHSANFPARKAQPPVAGRKRAR